GQTAFGLGAALGIHKDDAAAFIDDYFARYAEVSRFIDHVLQQCRQTGYATTILRRRREITGIRSERYPSLNLPARTAVSTVSQGPASGPIKQAMINDHRRPRDESSPGRLLLQNHDDLVFEAPAAAVDDVIALAGSEMESALELDVPI